MGKLFSAFASRIKDSPTSDLTFSQGGARTVFGSSGSRQSGFMSLFPFGVLPQISPLVTFHLMEFSAFCLS